MAKRRDKLAQGRRLEALSAFVAHCESEHGEITPQEMRLAQRRAQSRTITVRGAGPQQKRVARKAVVRRQRRARGAS
jgi:hypothetical protein